LIVCEAKPKWSVAWRRALRGTSFQVIETRAIVHLEEALREHPAALVVIEVTAASLAKVVPAVERLARRFPAAAFLPVIDRSLMAAEPFLREGGAFHVLYSRREVPQAVRFLRRHAGGQA
jgi:hypothetical protein